MNLETVIFYMFSALVLFAGLRVITARNPVHAAMFLVLAFCSMAGVWMLAEAEFLSITLILVYVGAVMVLFLFVVMMLDINLDQLREGFWRWFPFGAALALVMVGEMVYVLGNNRTAATVGAVHHAADYSNIKELGRLIYTDYVYPFEIAAVLLLVAMVAAIGLTLRSRTGVKKQDPGKQVLVKKSDRLRIVSVPAEKAAADETAA